MIRKNRNGLVLDDKNLAHDLIWNKGMTITKAAKKFDVAISTMHRIKMSDLNKSFMEQIPKKKPENGLAVSYKNLELWAKKAENTNKKMFEDNLSNFERWANDRKKLEFELITSKRLLQNVIECPYLMDEYTIPMTGNTNNVNVMGTIKIQNIKRVRIKTFLKNGK